MAAPRTSPAPRSVGLVHDYLLVMRGAERAFEQIAAIYPQAPIKTLLYDERGTEGRFGGRIVETSYLQRLGIRQRGFRALLPLYPRAAERLPVADHDLVISSSTAFAHGVRRRDDATHVCYCATPFRYAWHEREQAIASVARPLRRPLARLLERIGRWDLEAARGVDRYIAVSQLSRRRIADLYGREAAVVHPPVAIDRFRIGVPGEYLLFVGEIVMHKQIGIALEATRLAGRRIKVVGQGPDLERLRARYGDSAEFLGRVSDAELEELYAKAAALVVPNIEEFGIAAVEAQAAGRPVLGADAGGARETVIDGETGVLFPPGDVRALARCIEALETGRFSPQRARSNAERFGVRRFREQFAAEIEAAWRERQLPGAGPHGVRALGHQ